uniref:Restriction endonuclease n=1 Tax=Pithovirus LCPAC404 TaxID=2506597 RepID=A0A481ZCZ5_9VIRU|nr:MAG: restriction endonuclease [Pithovirus LCPAC404]
MRSFIFNNYKFIIFILVLIFVLIWISFGRQNHDFVGLKTCKVKDEKIDKESQSFSDNITIIAENDNAPRGYEDNRGHSEVPTTFKEVKIKRRSKGEAECHSALKRMFGREFKTVRPDFMKSTETGRNLELDLFDSELKLAVEYNGRQHYTFPSFPGFTKDQFLQQVRRDKYKRNVCDVYGIYLIIVPHTVNLEDIYDYIKEKIPYTLERYLVE